MQIWHRITFGHVDGVDTAIADMNIQPKRSPLPGGGYLIHVDITESDPQWPQIAALAGQKKALDIYDTIFTHEEILNAEWIRLIPTFAQGYPQPEEDMAWKQITYEDQCPKCGVGYRQKAPFRLAREPRMGKHDFVCLYWTYTVFCTLKALETLKSHEACGYEAWGAILHRTGEPSRTVSQLRFPMITEPGLADEDKSQPETCPTCGITKYASHLRGYMRYKRTALRPDTDFQVTCEWFGSGGYSGFREILASNRVAKLILEQGWRGLALKPIELK